MAETNSVEQGSENDILMITVHGNENINNNVNFEHNVKIKDRIDREQKKFKRLPEEFSKRSPEEFSKRSPEEFSKRSPEEFSKRSPEEFSKLSPEEFSKCSSDPVLPREIKRNIESLPFNPLSNENLSQMEAKIGSLSNRGRPVNILVIGPAGSGKSTLIDAMFGEDVVLVYASAKSVTRKVEAYKGKYEGVEIKIYDSVGFGDTEGRTGRSILYEIDGHGQFDLILICTKLGGRVNRDMFSELASVLNEEMWKRTVVVLTFANQFKTLESVKDSKKSLENQMNVQMIAHKACVVDYLSKSVKKDVLEQIPFCLAGEIDKKIKLFLTNNWLKTLWETCINCSSDDARPFLTFYARNRGFIEAGSVLGAVGAGAGIGAVVGAGIGSVVPGAGTAIGAAVGAGVGGVVSLVGVGLGRIFR
uniref:G domain-containing protein n=1 Tax=Amphimedon queenslandica TaxID=400682 RepID=A0A1X7T0R5_AMPQE